MQVYLSSGEAIQVTRVKLFEGPLVRKAAALRQEAIQKLQGVSLGLGFLGGFGWVLAGAAALSALEGVLSSSSQKKGLQLLKEEQAVQELLTERGRFFDVRNIAKLSVPAPSAWVAKESISDQYVDQLDKIIRDSFIAGLAIEQKGWFSKPEKWLDWVHDGNEFITIEAATEEVRSVRWSAVVSVQVPN